MDKITIKEYVQREDYNLFDCVLNSLKPKNKFLNKETQITLLSYKTVKIIQQALTQIKTFDGLCDIYVMIFDIKADDFWNAQIDDLFSSQKYIFNEFEKIGLNEIAMSKSEMVDEVKWKASGGDRLQDFNIILSVESICERYGFYPFDIIEKPYHEIFFLQSMLKIQNEVNYNYNKLK